MKIAQLREQQAAGFRRLRFGPELEQYYRTERDRGIRERARPVSASALVLFILYALLDTVMLPPDLARQTIAVRLLITCPAIVGVWWLSYRRNVAPTTFVSCYALAYLTGGLSVVAIIALARLYPYPLPYDGILLMVMFGYFVMELPFRTVSVASALVILAYLAMELATGMDPGRLMINGFFIFTANTIGMVGSWLSEYRQRAHFLDRQMLDASRREAEQENSRKTHLITVASHDLRQPLNVISLILENLSSNGLRRSQAKLISKLKTSVAHFNGLLGSVLDISRIQEGMITPELQHLGVGEALQQLVDACVDHAAKRGIRLEVSPPAEPLGVLADPQLFHRIIQNLVVNALEHSHAQRVVLQARWQDDRVRIEVSDDGRGINPGTLAHVFDPFFRADRGPQPQSGLGLGLAIVRELTEMMDGSCGVSSSPGDGSCFWVCFPATTPPAIDRVPPRLWPSPTRGEHRLLVVEDHDEARHWVCETLSKWGYNTLAFATAEQALDHCRHKSTDLLISDYRLPAMSGHTLFDQLSARQAIKGGILMTADTGLLQGYDRQRRLWVLHKPLSPMRLRAAIMQLTC